MKSAVKKSKGSRLSNTKKIDNRLLAIETKSLRPYKSRLSRPCDFCRKRKTCCIIKGLIPCTSCVDFNFGQCTFLEGPVKRKSSSLTKKSSWESTSNSLSDSKVAVNERSFPYKQDPNSLVDENLGYLEKSHLFHTFDFKNSGFVAQPPSNTITERRDVDLDNKLETNETQPYTSVRLNSIDYSLYSMNLNPMIVQTPMNGTQQVMAANSQGFSKYYLGNEYQNSINQNASGFYVGERSSNLLGTGPQVHNPITSFSSGSDGVNYNTYFQGHSMNQMGLPISGAYIHPESRSKFNPQSSESNYPAMYPYLDHPNAINIQFYSGTSNYNSNFSLRPGFSNP